MKMIRITGILILIIGLAGSLFWAMAIYEFINVRDTGFKMPKEQFAQDWRALNFAFKLVGFDVYNQQTGISFSPVYAAQMTLDPKADTSFGSALIDGKLEDFKKVTSYRLYACSYKTVPKK